MDVADNGTLWIEFGKMGTYGWESRGKVREYFGRDAVRKNSFERI
jgi:hypothetical protein